MEITLQQLFGKSATQNSQVLTIQKSDLPLFTATANNRGEQLLVAILLQAWKEFEGLLIDEEGNQIVDETGHMYDRL